MKQCFKSRISPGNQSIRQKMDIQSPEKLGTVDDWLVLDINESKYIYYCVIKAVREDL